MRVAELLNTTFDAAHVWTFASTLHCAHAVGASVDADHYSKPSNLLGENGFAIDLMYLERDKRVVVSADFAHDLYRHRRCDDPCRNIKTLGDRASPSTCLNRLSLPKLLTDCANCQVLDAIYVLNPSCLSSTSDKPRR